ncbi:hypothetical protein ACXYMU_04450 [Pontibacter sp. CAU 1760]
MFDQKYKGYTAEQFAEDEAFWLWVLGEDKALNAAWDDFLRAHPEQAACMEEARGYVLELNGLQHTLPESKSQALFDKIQHSISESEVNPNSPTERAADSSCNQATGSETLGCR